MNIQLFNKSCFDAFKEIPDQSVDMVCVDPPYGTTTIEWDKTLDFDLMWKELGRIVKPKGNIVIFGSQPFTSLVIVSKLDWFRHELIWNKNKCGSPGLSKYRPQKVHENIMLFSKESGGTYNPIIEEGEAYKREAKDKVKGYGKGINSHGYGFKNAFMGGENHGTRYPKSILHASRNFSAQQTVHPTQKPTNVLNWLIMTYSNPGDTVMDFTPEHKQLSTQLPEGIQTTPDEKYEQGVLEVIRDPNVVPKQPKAKKTKQNKLVAKFGNPEIFNFGE